MPNSQATPEQRMLFVEQVYSCAIFVVFIFDWIVLISQETRAYWQQRLQVSSAFYIFCRYVPLVTGAICAWSYTAENTSDICSKTYLLPVAFATVNQIAAQAALVWRVHRMGGGSAVTLGSHLSGLAVVSALQLYAVFQHLTLRPFDPSPPPFKQYSGCFPQATSMAFIIYFVLPMVFILYITVLMTMRAWGVAKHATAVAHAQSHGQAEQGHVKSFITTLRTKNLWPFYVIFVAYLSATIVFAGYFHSKYSRLSLLQAPFIYFFPNLLCCRLLLNDVERELRSSGDWPVSFLTGITRPAHQRTKTIGFAAHRSSLYGHNDPPATHTGGLSKLTSSGGTRSVTTGTTNSGSNGDRREIVLGSLGGESSSSYLDVKPKKSLSIDREPAVDVPSTLSVGTSERDLFYRTHTPEVPKQQGHPFSAVGMLSGAENAELHQGTSLGTPKYPEDDRDSSKIAFAPVGEDDERARERTPVPFVWRPHPV